MWVCGCVCASSFFFSLCFFSFFVSALYTFQSSTVTKSVSFSSCAIERAVAYASLATAHSSSAKWLSPVRMCSVIVLSMMVSDSV